MTRAAGALALVLAVLTGLAPTAVAQDDVPEGSVTLVSQTPWLEAEGSFDLLLDVDEVADPEDVDLVVTVHGRIRSRSSFARSLEGRASGTSRTVELALDEVATDANGNVRVSLPLPRDGIEAGPTTLRDLTQGVYPVSVALRGRDGDTIDRFMTHLVRLPEVTDSLEPLAVAWVQPIGAAPALQPDGTRTLSPTAQAGASTALDALDADLDLTVDATPETLAALEPDVLAPLGRAVERGQQVLATPYVDLDVSALAAAGLADDLAVQREAGEDALLAAAGTRGDPRTWSSDRGLTAAALSRLRALGVTRVVVPEGSLEPLDPDLTSGTTLLRPFSLSAAGDQVVEAAAVDPGLTDHFQAGPDQVLAAHQLLADLAVLFFDLPGAARGVVVRPPERWRPSTAFLGTVLPALADVPIVRPVTLDELFDDVEPLVDDDLPVVREVRSDLRVAPLPTTRFADAHRAIEQLVALAGPGDVVDAARRRLLAAESSRLDAAGRNALLASVLGRRDDVVRRVEMPADRRTFRLTAREGTIPLTIRNDNPFPVRVELVLSSEKLDFEGGRSRIVLALVLEPGLHTETVPVRTRVSSKFPMQVELVAPDGTSIRRAQVTIISTAFSGVGIVLSIGAGFFLLLWWASHWRTVRRDRRLVEAPK